MSEAEAEKTARAERPILVYVYEEGEEGNERFAIEQDRAFQDDKTAVGARFFDCVRIEKENAAADRTLAEAAKKAPCLVFVRPNYEVASVMRAKFNANKVFSAMCTPMRKDYENCVSTVFKKQRALWKEQSKLQRDRDEIAKLDTDIAEEANDRRRESLQAKKDELAAELAKAEGALQEAERALYDCALKPDKTS